MALMQKHRNRSQTAQTVLNRSYVSVKQSKHGVKTSSASNTTN